MLQINKNRLDIFRFWLSTCKTKHYQPLGSQAGNEDPQAGHSFSLHNYLLFFIVGAGIMWTWNTIVAAAPYFRSRFESNDWILHHYESAIIFVFSCTILISMLVLTRMHTGARYKRRVYVSLSIYLLVSSSLAISSIIGYDSSPVTYFVFTLVASSMVGIANGLSQNGVFAFVSGRGRPEYTQAVILGSALAGICTPLSEIISISFGRPSNNFENFSRGLSHPQFSWNVVYFSFAGAISMLACVSFILVDRRLPETRSLSTPCDGSTLTVEKLENIEGQEGTGLWSTCRTLGPAAVTTILCFAGSAVSLVFATKISSLSSQEGAISVYRELFIPIAFLTWHCGDFLGSFIPLFRISAIHNSKVLLCASVLRIGFLPIFPLCNYNNNGSLLGGDLFYLIFVQVSFGLTNGWISSACIMGAAGFANGRKEMAGAVMGLCIVAGLTLGSLVSFFVT